MNTQLLLLALTELILSMFIGIGILYITAQVLNRFIKKRHNIADNNTAYTLVAAATLFSVGYIVAGSLQPILTTLRLLSDTNAKGDFTLFFKCAQYVIVFILIGLVVGILINLATLKIYNSFTKGINEIQEISEGNINTAIIVAIILVVMSLFVRDGYVLLLESLIPYNEVVKFNR